MKKFFLIGSVLVLFQINLIAQTPCVNGMAGEYPCCGYDLLSNMSIEDMGVIGQGNDIWGWTDPLTGKEYALYGQEQIAAFIDISDPLNPIYVGYINAQTEGSIWRDIKVYNDFAFIVSEAYNHGMQVFDLTRLRNVSNPPMEFEPDAFLGNMGGAHNIVINEETGFAYAVGADTYNGGPSFIDISDPLNPVTVGGFDADGYTHDAQVVIYEGSDTDYLNHEVFFGFNGNSLTIVDVTDKNDPVMISRLEYEQTGYTHQGWLNEEHTLVYLGDETDEGTYGFNTRTIIIDVNDLDNPFLLEQYFGTTTATDHNMYVKGDKIFQANYKSGMRVLQINDEPGNRLEEVAFFDVYPENDEPFYKGTWSVYPYFASGNIIINSRDRGLFVVAASASAACVVGIDEWTDLDFDMYPNPAHTVLNIDLSNINVLESIYVYDMVGRPVISVADMKSSGTIYPLGISDLSPGIYTIVVNGNIASKQFVVN